MCEYIEYRDCIIYNHISFILKNQSIGHLYTNCNANPNSKYKLNENLDDIFYVLKTGISWRNLRSTIPWKSIYF